MEVVRWVGFVFGITIVCVTFGSMVRSLVLPRGQTSRIAFFVGRRIVRQTIEAFVRRSDDYEYKDRLLALSAPLALLAVLLAWLVLFGIGYSLILWPLIESTYASALREAGSSLLTLGFASTPTPSATVVNLITAATGLIVVALQIAYLPTIYSSFNRRETLVTMLQSRAGAPAWGPEILARSALVRLDASLPGLYADWEQWSADVAESHTTYPILAFFRSPHPLRNWVVALTAVLDAAALQLAMNPSTAPVQARLCLRMGFTCLRDIAATLRIPYDPDPFPDDPIELTYEEFLGGIHRLQEAGYEMERTPEEAWPHFKGWRVNYEDIAYTLADRMTAPPAPWTGVRSNLPGVTIVPQRPPNRSPDRPEHAQEPKAERFGWRA